MFCFSEMFTPHSGQVFGFDFWVWRLLRLYLHFWQCGCVEVSLPIRPLVRRAMAMSVDAMMIMIVVDMCGSRCLWRIDSVLMIPMGGGAGCGGFVFLWDFGVFCIWRSLCVCY